MDLPPSPTIPSEPQEPPAPGQPQSYVAPPVAKRNTNWKWIAIIGGVVTLCCLVACVLASVFGYRLIKAGAEKTSEANVVLDSFMKAMERKDFDSAQALFSNQLSPANTRAELEKIAQNSRLFEGYERLQVQGFNYKSLTNDGDGLTGNVLEVNGKVHYNDGSTGRFESTLHLEGGQWKIYGIDIHLD